MKTATVGTMTLSADQRTYAAYTRFRDTYRAGVKAQDAHYTDNDRWTDYLRMVSCAEIMTALEEAGA